jgi:phenylalanyl-tRNA synthetase beta chain
LKLAPLLAAIEETRAKLRFAPIPRFPSVERDFSLVLPDGITFGQVESTIRSLGIVELKDIKAADLFRGGQVPAGNFSLMIRVRFQSLETTFTDEQLADFSARIVDALGKRLAAKLRAS